ncbi:LysR family transcriptional regulator [Phytohalomonas tamaricis]|uniref:LysR family transcriptional regulator n=1 Tax=Phytohalomonas tamaricis TaxID=2081032 RepID=UPI0021D440C9|nr:LysR family transcriptional regulator [Phytohalomonas tamaricis]
MRNLIRSHSISLVALHVFERVAATGSFTSTAHELQMAVSSVSRHVTALETALGQRLLFRHTRAVSLTEAGKRYYRDVREVLERLDLATESIVNPDAQPSGLLHLNGPVAFGRRHITPLLTEFQRAYPAIEAELTLTDAFIDPVQEGVDITFRVGPLVDSSLVARKLAEMRFIVCAAPAYLREHGIPQCPEQLLEHNCLVYKGPRGQQRWYFHRHGELAPGEAFQPYEVRGNLGGNDAESLLVAALAGQGIVLFPTWLVSDELKSGALVPLLSEWDGAVEPQPQAIHVIYPENRLRSPKVGVFLDYLFARVGAPPYWDEWHRR